MRYDVIIMGAGPAGMIAMARFAAAGFRVLGLERQKEQPLDAKDLRSTAFLMPSVALLEKAGLWQDLAPKATALDVMEIVDAKRTPPKHVAFLASEISQEHFGFNLMNRDLHQILRRYLKTHDKVDLRFDVQVSGLMQFEDYVELRMGDETVQTRLLVGADGRQSSVREMAGISAKITPFDQMAQVFTVTHEEPHRNVSTEVHYEGGPFTVVPLADVDGQYASAVVWMDRPEAVEARAAMDDDEFNQALNARSFGIRGEMKKASALGAFPMVTLEAYRMSLDRVALVAEAAHVVPPIGAQGLNMSLRDVETLVRICERGALQDPKYLENWGRQRKMDVVMRKNGIRLLNNVSIGEMSRSDAMRRLGLDFLERKSPLKSGLMRMGLGR